MVARSSRRLPLILLLLLLPWPGLAGRGGATGRTPREARLFPFSRLSARPQPRSREPFTWNAPPSLQVRGGHHMRLGRAERNLASLTWASPFKLLFPSSVRLLVASEPLLPFPNVCHPHFFCTFLGFHSAPCTNNQSSARAILTHTKRPTVFIRAYAQASGAQTRAFANRSEGLCEGGPGWPGQCGVDGLKKFEAS